ncbi:hypothetical protein [Vagococcus fluvialis]|uniref:hypothetical protein n=1 Tax=Vagococcus fluvialis TaxID=2738 RepID=UPI0037AD0C10
MKLYHGTTEKNGPLILDDCKIITNAHGHYDNDSGFDESVITTKGFTYLTSDLAYAIYYANKNSVLEHSREYAYIFEIEIDEHLIEPDFDEIKMVPEMADICYRTPKELIIGEEVQAYAKFKMGTNKSATKEELANLNTIITNSSMDKLNSLNCVNPLPNFLSFINLENH